MSMLRSSWQHQCDEGVYARSLAVCAGRDDILGRQFNGFFMAENANRLLKLFDLERFL
jgi:hypothetical protein